MAVSITVIKTSEGIVTGKTEAEARSKIKKRSRSKSSSPEPELPTSNLNNITPVATTGQTAETVQQQSERITRSTTKRNYSLNYETSKDSVVKELNQTTNYGTGETYTHYPSGYIERSNINPMAELVRQGGSVEYGRGQGGRPQLINIVYPDSAVPIYERSFTPSDRSEVNEITGYRLNTPNTTVRGVTRSITVDKEKKSYSMISDSLRTQAQLNYGSSPTKAYFQSAGAETLQFSGDFYKGFSQTIKNPTVWGIAGGVAFGGALLATKNPVLAGKIGSAVTGIGAIGLTTYLMFPRTTVKVKDKEYIIEGQLSKVGNKELGIGQIGGELTAFYVAGKTTSKIIQVSPQLWGDKSAKVGGRSAKQRSNKHTKAELRKQSYNAQRNANTFYDKQRGEVGIRVRSDALKQQHFTKSRTIRVSARPDNYGHVTMVKDQLLGRRGSLTTDYLNKVSFGSRNSGARYNKFYPKGSGSQSLSGQDLIRGNFKVKQAQQYLTIQRAQTTNIYNVKPVKTGKVPQITTGSVKTYKGSSSGAETKLVAIKTHNPFKSSVKTTSVVVNTGGFRTGQKDILLKKLYGQRNLKIRTDYISDLSSSLSLPPPKATVKPTLSLIPTTKFKRVELLTQAQNIITLSGSDSKIKTDTASVSLLGIAQGQDIAQLQTQAQAVAQPQAQRFKTVTKLKTLTFPSDSKTKSSSRRPKPVELIQKPIDNTKQFNNIIREVKPPKDPKPRDPTYIKLELPDFKMPKFKKSGQAFRSMKKPPKQPTTYNPTIYSIVTGLKASSISKLGVATGLGIRPVVKEKKKKKLKDLFRL